LRNSSDSQVFGEFLRLPDNWGIPQISLIPEGN